jgi:hypothetical protein
MINSFRLVIFSVGFCALLLIFAISMAPNSMTRSASATPWLQSDDRSESRSSSQAVELGDVQWLRKLDTAVENSKKEDKPIAILFQEVPG